MEVFPIKSFFYIREVQQTTIVKVYYKWEIKLAKTHNGEYYGSAVSTYNDHTKIGWESLGEIDESQAIEVMKEKCNRLSK